MIKEKKRIANKKYILKNKEKMPRLWRKYKQTWKNKNPEKYKFGKYKYKAKKRGLSFELSVEEFVKIISGKCHYCGAFEKIGIDRKNNKVGYIPKNCLSCCWDCNFLKGSKEYKFFINRCKAIAKFNT